MTIAERSEALRDLIQLRRPVDEAAEALSAFAWDSEQDLVRLDRSDAARLLDAYLGEHISDHDTVRWAAAIEGRDDVALAPGSEEMLKEFLFELATPEITESLTADRAASWKARLAGAAK